MGNSKYDSIFNEYDKEIIIKDYTDNYLSIRDILKKYNIGSKVWLCNKVLKGYLRNYSEATKIAHKFKSENFKHSEETKQKIREIRLKYIKEHPEKTAWRKRNEPSYPEKMFMKFLIEKGYDKKYLIEREKSVFPYFIDFAFVDEMLAVEIDGSQHWLDEERIEHDALKDKALISAGWKVLRITEDATKNDWGLIDYKIQQFLSKNISYERVGILKTPKKRKKVERGKDGLSEKERLSHYNQRKVINRPSYEQLIEWRKYKTLKEIGNMYNVSETTIRKWIRIYKKHLNL